MERVAACRGASRAELTQRIREIEQASDIERLLEINAAALALAGVLLGVFKDRRFLAVPAVVLGFLLQHGIQGWCPPIPPFRSLGVRTRQELDAEKYALKVLRGDFRNLLPNDTIRHDARTSMRSPRWGAGPNCVGAIG
jgi:hypothetical protein